MLRLYLGGSIYVDHFENKSNLLLFYRVSHNVLTALFIAASIGLGSSVIKEALASRVSTKLPVAIALLYAAKEVSKKANLIEAHNALIKNEEYYDFYMYIWTLLYASYAVLPLCQ